MGIREDLSAVSAREATDGGNVDRDKAPAWSCRVVWLMILTRAAIPRDYTQPRKPSRVGSVKADPGVELFAVSEGTVSKQGALALAPPRMSFSMKLDLNVTQRENLRPFGS